GSVDENTLPSTPSVYGKSKAEGEKMLEAWATGGGCCASLRLPGVVGAGGRNNFLCDSLEGVLADRTIRARNPDALFNNVVHVDDLAQFVVALGAAMPAGAMPLTV